MGKFYPTVRRTLKLNEHVCISFSRPSIQCFKENSYAKSFKDVLYFYYDVEVLYKNKVIFHADAHDFPKVPYLSDAIDYILSDEHFLLEGEEGVKHPERFHRINYFKRYRHQEFFEQEYGMKFECEKSVVKQWNESEYKTFKHYKMYIFRPKHLYNKWMDNRAVQSELVLDVTEDVLMKLKTLGEEFIEASINWYNQYEAPEIIQYYKERGLT